MACHCNEFSRSHMMRAAAAQAGQGLPRIETGMPLPAGTGLSRRSFLLRSGAAALSVYGASRLGLDELQAGVARAQGSNNPVLVSVFLDGGADSLSIIAPTGIGAYHDARPSLALQDDESIPFRGETQWRWNEAAAPLDQLHRAGKMSIFPSIGYTDPDQSHFTSRHYWEVGDLETHLRTGWMGRLLDRIGVDDNPLQGLSLDGWLSPGLATASNPVAAIDGTEYDLWAPGVWNFDDDGPRVEELMHGALGSIGGAHAGGSVTWDGHRKAGRVAQQASQLHSQLDAFGEFTVPSGYPDHYFGESLAGLAAMLGVGLPITCAALSGAGGYDTHDSQEDSFGNDLGTTAQALAAFQDDLENKGIADRVITLVWSEFGRRPDQNGTGTDHGAAGTAFLIGNRVRDQIVGSLPDLGDLDEDDNLKHTIDYRAVYSSIIDQWFGDDPGAVIPDAGQFEHPALIE